MDATLGIDLGTSALKVLVVDASGAVRAATEVPLTTLHPAPLASEQDVTTWWAAACTALDRLAAEAPAAMQSVAGIGLSGQMHGAVLLDEADRPVRSAMLWNDGRAHAEADELKHLGADLAAELGVPALAGLTAPKLLWLARHEPRTTAAARSLLLPKDVLRLHLTGERATDMSDAAGTWLLDEARRRWSERAITATSIDPSLLPRLVEGTDVTGTLRPALADRFGLRRGVIVAGGGGDTPCGGIGIGAVEEGRAFVGLGTSAQLFVASCSHRPAPDRMVHAFCHALPGRWYQMAAMLNGAGVLASIASLLDVPDIGVLIREAEVRFTGPSRLIALPYLSGERTPHDDPHARGVVFGLTPDTSRADLVQAAMEGVAFTFADARDALAEAGTRIDAAGFVGGGARSRLWARMIAAVMDVPLRIYSGAARGPAFGAARLARLALGGDPAETLAEPPVEDVVAPEPALVDAYAARLPAFRRLYAALKPEFAGGAMAALGEVI